ncbi:MAG: NAD(+) kinase [Coxiellaceae bacterium]|jgi:NAD+ kinase|nr:NAD(+) kinase [Coxiellaceae bacterium]
MAPKFKNIVIIGHQNTPNITKTLLSLIKHLQTKKVNVFLESDTANIIPNCNIAIIPREKLKNSCDLIVVVGGDGSLLSASRIAARQNLPIVGINRGDLGFLTDVPPNNLAKIDEILEGKFYQENRFLLTTEMENQKNLPIRNLALNDVVLLSAITGHMIELNVWVDQKFLCGYRADGLIVATPTGSTAHALSSDGPILYPTLDNIVLVPVLSHNLSSRPIVISSKSKIKIIFDETNTTDLLVLCDGQIQTMTQGDTIIIRKAKEKLRLLHPIDYSYFETLRTKLHWEKEPKKLK